MSFSKPVQDHILKVLIDKYDLLDKLTQDSVFSSRFQGRYSRVGSITGSMTIKITEVNPKEVLILQDILSDVMTKEIGDLYDMDAISERIIAQFLGNKKRSVPISERSSKRLAGRAGKLVSKTGAIQGKNGRFISRINLHSLLEAATKKYVEREMVKPDAHLKKRTGRFQESIKIESFQLTSGSSVDVTYNYRTKPYSVFDPDVSTYRGLSVTPFRGARNPRTLISNAIKKAAQDIMHSRYTITPRLQK